MREKNNNGLEVGDYQTDHHRIQATAKDFLIFDAQNQQADTAFEQSDVGEQEDLRHPGEEVDIFVVFDAEIPTMSSITVFHGYDL